jgi:hypothetical protein
MIMADTTIFKKSWQGMYSGTKVQQYNIQIMNTAQSQLRYIRNAYTSHNNPAAKQYIYFSEVIYRFLRQTFLSLPYDYKRHCVEGDISWPKTQAQWG